MRVSRPVCRCLCGGVFGFGGMSFRAAAREARRPERPAPAPAGVAGLRAGYLLLIRLRRFFSTSRSCCSSICLRTL